MKAPAVFITYGSTRDPTVPLVRTAGEALVSVTEFLGEGYGHASPESLKALQMMRESVGIIMDGTYAGKMLAGGLEFIRRNNLSGRNHLFLQTCNEVDFSAMREGADYQLLPAGCHRYFESGSYVSAPRRNSQALLR